MPTNLVARPSAVPNGVQHAVKNTAIARYLTGLHMETGQDVTLDVGVVMPGEVIKTIRRILRRSMLKDEETDDDNDNDHDDWASLLDLDWSSHLLYLSAPLFTAFSITFMIILADWWGLSILLSLMLSRILNIWAIKSRTSPLPSASIPDLRTTEYLIDLGGGHKARLRGSDADLQALLTQAWLRAQSQIDGYLEAMAKLLVYLAAALGGNMTQGGSIVLAGLLLSSAACLGLSNAHARGFRMQGRYARPGVEAWQAKRASST